MGGIMKKEYWKPVVGYEGLYEVSNWGRVKSLRRLITNQYNSFYIEEKILKNWKNSKGYCLVTLSKNGTYKKFQVHRLVALHFLPNPSNLPEVNHKDENPQNNIVSNLEWCDRLYNVRYGTGIERQKKKQLNDIKKSKPVLQYDLEGNLIREWKSVTECGMNGYNQGHVAACCRGERKTHKGFIWEYK